jgi:glyoxylase-like metal-dependent hydrolase (beta-lactamase superfamily II)
MSLTVHTLNLGDIGGDRAFLVRGVPPGEGVTVPANAFLILGGEVPVLVDTGARSDEVISALGMVPSQDPEQTLQAQLAQHGLEPGDIGMVIQTHLHVDHAGGLEAFPMTTPVVVNRAELAFAFGGLQAHFYVQEDLAHVLQRLYTPGALAILDLDLSGPVTVAPGIRCQATGGHTDGSLSVLVETDAGVANICGDVVYTVQDSLVDRIGQLQALEPQTSNNFSTANVAEKAAIKRALETGRFLLPSHDRQGAVVEHGRVVGRVGSTVPGPVLPLQAEAAGVGAGT